MTGVAVALPEAGAVVVIAPAPGLLGYIITKHGVYPVRDCPLKEQAQELKDLVWENLGRLKEARRDAGRV